MGKSKPMTTDAARRMQSAMDRQIAAGNDTSDTLQAAKGRVMSAASKNEGSSKESN